MYTLVGASLLGFDLSRRRGGALVAEVLSWALALEPAAVPVLDALHAETTSRDAAWLRLAAAVGSTPDLLTVLARTSWDTDPTEALAVLASAPLGSFDGLLRLVRNDVFDWLAHPRSDEIDDPPGRGTIALVCDAVAAAYAEEHLEAVERRALTAPWVAAVRRVPPRRPDLGPGAPALRALLDRLARATPGEQARLGIAAERLREQRLPWARAMHAATWAAYLADRIRTTAAAQLAAVIALRSAGVGAEESAAGTWNVVSAAVQALAVEDLLTADEVETLLHQCG